MQRLWWQWWLLLPYTFLSSALQAEGWESYLHWDALAYSETVTLSALMDGWQGGNHGGDNASLLSRAEAGIATERWKLGLLHRYDYQLHFTPQTATFFHQQKNGQLDDPTRIYQLDLDGAYFQATGLTASWVIAVNDQLQIEFSGDYLEGQDFRVIDLHATGTFAELDNWRSIEDLRFKEQYRYNDGLLERFGIPERETAAGKGYAFGIQLDWKQDCWNGYLALDDLFGKIYWKQAVITTLHMQSGMHNTWFPEFPDHGRQVVVEQSLPIYKRAGVGYQLTPQWSLYGDLQSTPHHNFYQIGSVWKVAEDVSIELQMAPVEQAFGAGVSTPWLTLSLMSDAAQFSEARYLSLNLFAGIEW